jgi:RNA polymerase-associated protein LEO1
MDYLCRNSEVLSDIRFRELNLLATSDTEMSDSDSRDKVEETRNAMDDLFGDDDDSDQGNRASQDKDGDEIMGNANGVDDSGLSTAERDHRRAMEYAEDEEPEEIHLREANVSIPVVPKPRSSDEKVRRRLPGSSIAECHQFWVLRLPNFLKIDSRPFHSQTYTGPEDNEEDGGISARERSMSIRLQVENTVRWRWAKDDAGNDVRAILNFY